jgi:hypothetical protein
MRKASRLAADKCVAGVRVGSNRNISAAVPQVGEMVADEKIDLQ